MATPTTGTIPALAQYGTGGLAIASTVAIEIVDTTNATAAASYRMSQIDFVGKAPGVMSPANPLANDVIAFLQVASNLPKVTTIGSLAIPSGNLPTGGGTGTLLAKNSATNYDANWTSVGSFLLASTSITLSGSTTVSVSVSNQGITSTQIATNTIGNGQLRQGPAISVLGVAGAATANVADIISAAASSRLLMTNAAGNALSFQQAAVANLSDGSTGTGVIVLTNSPTINTPTIGTATINTGTLNNVTLNTAVINTATLNRATINTATIANATINTATINNATLSTAVIGTSTLNSPTLNTATINTGTLNNVTVNTATINNATLNTATVNTATLNNVVISTATITKASLNLLNTLAANQIGSAVDTTSFTVAYNRYRITFENVCPVATAQVTASLNMVVATTGVAWIAASYISNVQTFVNATAAYASSTTVILLSGNVATTTIGTSTSYGANGFIELTNPANAVFRKGISGEVAYMATGAAGTATNAVTFPCALWDGGANAITGIAISFQTGNIATGTIRIYGIS